MVLALFKTLVLLKLINNNPLPPIYNPIPQNYFKYSTRLQTSNLWITFILAPVIIFLVCVHKSMNTIKLLSIKLAISSHSPRNSLPSPYLVDVGDQLALRWVPVLLFGSSQLGLDVEQLYFNVGPLCIPSDIIKKR